MTYFIIPAVITAILIYGLVKGVDVFQTFLEGAKEGLKTSANVLPALIALMTCIGMFKASGGLDVLVNALSPLTDALHAPRELLPLALLRPLSGSGALTVFEGILKQFGPDTRIGRTASVMMGSTETTFYTFAVYYGASHIKNTRHTLFCSIVCDIVGFLLSIFFTRVLF